MMSGGAKQMSQPMKLGQPIDGRLGKHLKDSWRKSIHWQNLFPITLIKKCLERAITNYFNRKSS